MVRHRGPLGRDQQDILERITRLVKSQAGGMEN